MKLKVMNTASGIETILECEEGEPLLSVLQNSGSFLSAPCNGRGSCGKCKVRLLQGKLPVAPEEQKYLSEAELQSGVRLACRLHTVPGMQIAVSRWEEEMATEAVAVTAESLYFVDGTEAGEEGKTEKNCFLAVDLGTTTIAMALVDAATGEVCGSYTGLNHQRSYGADVISRISAANAGKGKELQQLVTADILRGIESFGRDRIQEMILAGNTTMIHLLLGRSCKSLGVHPFVSDMLHKMELLWEGIPTTIFPGISAFVGGDIVADILVCPAFQTSELALLIDLGTNGEMVLGNHKRLVATSTAAGPALEGGNICCGVGSIPGAVSRVKIQNRRAVTGTIGAQMPPVGICGSGLISLAAELIRNRLVDAQGTLQEPYREQGFSVWKFSEEEKKRLLREDIILFQQDIRQFQMAKAAIRAGIGQLMEAYGCRQEEISTVYLAGGFGTGIRVEDAVTTGLLPKAFADKVVAIGNGCLKGCIRYGKGQRELPYREKIERISLAEREGFGEQYIEYMGFDIEERGT